MLLKGLQEGRPGRRGTRSSRKFAVATVVCLVLLALLAVIQVAHVHPLESDADHCPLCVVLHAAAPAAVTAAVVILVQVGTPAPVVQARVVARPCCSTLFTRPPPAAS